MKNERKFAGIVHVLCRLCIRLRVELFRMGVGRYAPLVHVYSICPDVSGRRQHWRGEDFKELLRGFRPKMLLIPLATIGGTLLFSALVSVLLTRWSVFDCLAVGSGLGYYSLSSILIMELKTPDLGAQLATELATIALLTNVIRELVALVGAPFICKYFGKLAPISVAGVTSVDVALPSIIRVSGKEMVPLAIFHGLLVDMSVPFFISLFCKL